MVPSKLIRALLSEEFNRSIEYTTSVIDGEKLMSEERITSE